MPGGESGGAQVSSTEASGALYIPTYEYNYKVITRDDPILHEYYITDMRNCEITKSIQV